MPRGLNPAVFISKIREKFVDDSSKFCEKHFYAVCDTQKETSTILKQLFEFHVRIVHVPCLKANTSDNVLRDLMCEFVGCEFVGYNKYSRLILISDSDFSHDIHNIRRNKKCDVILIHNQLAKESMIQSANSAYLFNDLIKEDITKHLEQQQKIQRQQIYHQSIPQQPLLLPPPQQQWVPQVQQWNQQQPGYLPQYGFQQLPERYEDKQKRMLELLNETIKRYPERTLIIKNGKVIDVGPWRKT